MRDHAGPSDAYSFAVMGDTLYSDVEERRMMWMIDDLSQLDLDVVVAELGEIFFSNRSSLGVRKFMLDRSFLRVR